MSHTKKEVSALQQIKDLAQENGFAVLIWMPDDVKRMRSDLTKAEAQQVLDHVENNHDANIGVNWDTLKWTADDLFPRAKKRRSK
jgi:hypothetical protein